MWHVNTASTIVGFQHFEDPNNIILLSSDSKYYTNSEKKTLLYIDNIIKSPKEKKSLYKQINMKLYIINIFNFL